MHVHRSRRVGKGLILILVNQRDALWVGDLNKCYATPRDGSDSAEKYGNLRPTLENVQRQIVALCVVIKRGREVTSPAASEILRLHQSELANKRMPPEVPVKKGIEHAIEKHAGGSVRPPRHRQMDGSKKLRRHPSQSNRQSCEEQSNDPLFVGVCTVAVHTAPARLFGAEQDLEPVRLRPPPSCRWESAREKNSAHSARWLPDGCTRASDDGGALLLLRLLTLGERLDGEL